MTVVTVHADGSSASVPITIGAPPPVIWTPSYLTDPKQFGWGYREGPCNAIQLDKTLIAPSGAGVLKFTGTPNDPSAPSAGQKYPDGTPGCFNIDRQAVAPATVSGLELLQYVNGGWKTGVTTDVYVRFAVRFPRSQTSTGNVVRPGDPTGPTPPGQVFPLIDHGVKPPMALQVFEIYGAPYAGSSPTGVGVGRGGGGGGTSFGLNYLYLSGGPLVKGYMNWFTPIVYDQWYDIVLHYVLSTNPAVGAVELWLNGVRQTFADGSQTWHYATISAADKTGPLSMAIQSYAWNVPWTLTVWHDAAPRVGASLAAVG